MIILKPLIFEQFPEIIFGLNTKIGLNRKEPYFFNLSHSVDDDEKMIEKNRKSFFSSLNVKSDNIVYQKQIHSSKVSYVSKAGNIGEGDALITDKPNLALTISTADCTPVFIYDKENKVIAGVHSGWRGTEKKILLETLKKLKSDFNSDPENLYVYIAPSISQEKYEVGPEVAEKFEDKYLLNTNGKIYLDVAGINYDILINFGFEKGNIQYSQLCSYKMKNLLHSYRRDGLHSGRSLGVIAMKAIND